MGKILEESCLKIYICPSCHHDCHDHSCDLDLEVIAPKAQVTCDCGKVWEINRS